MQGLPCCSSNGVGSISDFFSPPTPGCLEEKMGFIFLFWELKFPVYSGIKVTKLATLRFRDARETEVCRV